ncbi:MAG TPA: bifunctional oligoribonuclease/PAP phosphatase NrnA [Bacteroidota bacterium]|nr:bifunctional oligoribonuclease/PAP phosphatase NrnA [Bacteroidota bacterium]
MMEKPPPISSAGIAAVAAILRSASRLVLTTHVNPDGDGIGSELALAAALRSPGKQISILNHNETPPQYTWLDPDRSIVGFSPEKHADLIRTADLIAVIDTNQPGRLRSLEPFVLKSPAKILIIDHHLGPDPFANHYLIDEEATSTGEIVYRILTELGTFMTTEIATALYTAIMTDTGSFRYPRTDREIHRIAGELLAAGADPSTAFSNVYEQWTPGRMRLLGEMLDSMRTTPDGRIAWVICTREMFRTTGTSEVETDNFTTYPMSVRGVVLGILFNELTDGVKISFRSKGSIPVNLLAAEFGGGGHLNAAGARLFNRQLVDLIPEVVTAAEKYLSASRGT